MITQNYKQGKNEIKIEIAETLEDAKENNFSDGEYNRFYINGRKTDNYMAMIQFIVGESKKNKSKLVPTGEDLNKLRVEMINNQRKEISNRLQQLKNTYKNMGVSEDVLKQMNDAIDKIDPITGLRVKK